MSTISIANDTKEHAIVIDKIDGNVIYFKKPLNDNNTSSIKINLFEISFISFVNSSEIQKPLLLISAKPCANCLQDRSIYLINTEGTILSQFVYPGKIIDQKQNQVVYESRAFYGNCLSASNKHGNLKKFFPAVSENFTGDIYLVFQKDKIDRRKRHAQSILMATPGKNYTYETLSERQPASIQTVLKKVKSKDCFEIEGRNRRMLTKAVLDLKKQEDQEDNEDNDDSGND
ncbi:MAG: hypothetical protein HY072_09085 [Deltaproteobacteria bacterium]|nr:hypothetical protein [Deltaproteobacteria bacterium]